MGMKRKAFAMKIGRIGCPLAIIILASAFGCKITNPAIQSNPASSAPKATTRQIAGISFTDTKKHAVTSSLGPGKVIAYVSTYEITNAEYYSALGLKMPPGCNPKLPVTYISQIEAVRFAKFLSKKTGMVVELPSKIEWEAIARGGAKFENFPWGDSPDADLANIGTGAVMLPGSFPPNGYGLYDLMGNVWEMTRDVERIPDKKLKGGFEQFVVCKGGSFDNFAATIPLDNTISASVSDRVKDVGIRLVIVQ